VKQAGSSRESGKAKQCVFSAGPLAFSSQDALFGLSNPNKTRCSQSGLWSRKSRHPTPTPGNFDYPTPTPGRLRPSAVLVT